MADPAPSRPRDVRMRGFAERSRVESALAWVDQQSVRLSSETVPLEAAYGRILAESVTAQFDVPSFARSAMDGYALRADETVGAGDYHRIPFALAGEALPGRPYSGDLPVNAAVRIMTGAPLPTGADAVLPAEFADEKLDTVEAFAAVTPGKNVGHRGEDVKAGTVVAAAGRWLRPQDVGLLASVGMGQVSVVRQPRVRILTTGTELAAPGTPPGRHKIVDSNSVMIAGLVERDGGLIESQVRVPDDRDRIRAFLEAPGADVILVSGGSSVGSEDHAPMLVAELGKLAIHGIAMRPSSPTGMGTIGDALVFLLPGNPVSCLCAYDFFAGRCLRLRGGRRPDWPYAAREFEVGRKIVSAAGRVDYCRVQIVDGKIVPIAVSGASILSSTTRADGFIVVPEECEGYPPGARVLSYAYDPL